MFGVQLHKNAGNEYPVDQWERLWFALADRPWRSLAIVASQPGQDTIIVANALQEAATKFQHSYVLVVDASTAEPWDVQGIQNVVADEVWAGHRVIIALGDPLVHSPTIPLARFADASLLCVSLASADITHTRLGVKAVGSSRYIGSVTLDPRGKLARIRIGTLDVDAVTFDGALQAIDELVFAGKGGAVFTPNVDHVMLAEKNDLLRAAYSRANLSLADGVPIVWASRLIRPGLPAKVSGSDLLVPLMQLAGERAWRVYILGGATGVAAEAARMFTERYGVTIVGVDDAEIGLSATPAERDVVARIIAANPSLLVVALGSPKQELFIDRVRAELGSTVSIGLGASLDFATGRVRRAPAWVSGMGMEWLYRVSQEPGRLWKRYFVQDTQFILVLLRTLLMRPRSSRPLGVSRRAAR